MNSNEQAEFEGSKAYFCDKPKSYNPYRKDSEEYLYWDYGYDEAFYKFKASKVLIGHTQVFQT